MPAIPLFISSKHDEAEVSNDGSEVLVNFSPPLVLPREARCSMELVEWSGVNAFYSIQFTLALTVGAFALGSPGGGVGRCARSGAVGGTYRASCVPAAVTKKRFSVTFCGSGAGLYIRTTKNSLVRHLGQNEGPTLNPAPLWHPGAPWSP